MSLIRLSSATTIKLRGVGKPALVSTTMRTIALSDVATGYIYQRVGTSKAVPVNGSYTGNPASIQARYVPDGTPLSSTAYAWTTIATNPVGGMFSGLLTVPQGGWYNVHVRDGTIPSIAVAGTAKFGVGLRLALIGQSNMVHLSTSVSNYPLADQLTRRWNGAWSYTGNVDLTNAFPPGTTYGGAGYSSYTTGSPNGDGLVYLVNQLRASLNIPVATFEYAVSGSPISAWQPSGGSNYASFIAALNQVDGDCESAIWLQGENDANIGTSAASYQSSLTNIVNGLLTQTGRTSSNFKFGIVILGPGTTYAPEGNMGIIRGAHLATIAANAASYLAASATDMNLATDTIHFDALSEIRMGRRYAKGMLAAIGASTYGAQGPKITGATRSGTVITVNILQNGGTLLKDGAGGTGAALLGFRVFANGVLQTISTTAISSNTVTLTLSATPSGTITMDYAMANAPYTATTALASVVYDNDTVSGDTIGLPLRPLALITVV